jgi:Raf kinase inhibitor-like YbhB/YbcL family protein
MMKEGGGEMMLERKNKIKPMIMALCLLALMVGVTGCLRGVVSFDNLTLTSSGFEKLTQLPVEFSRDGGNLSPALNWSKAELPHGTKSFVLICDDLDAKNGIFNHWVVYNIPVTVRTLDQGTAKLATLPNGAQQGKNDFSEIGYDGPHNREPEHPQGDSHRFNFKLYALSKTLTFEEGDVTKEKVVEQMLNSIIGEGHLMGIFDGTAPNQDAGQEP